MRAMTAPATITPPTTGPTMTPMFDDEPDSDSESVDVSSVLLELSWTSLLTKL